MKKGAILILTTLLSVIFIFNGCKTSEETKQIFSIVSTSGFAKKMLSLDPDDTGKTSLSLFFAIRNHSKKIGVIRHWLFTIRHQIVNLIEISSDNFANFNLTATTDLNIPADTIKEFYVQTPQPIIDNALSKDKLSFDQFTPNEIIVEIEISDADGNTYSITSKGAFTYEQGIINESKYDIIGDWNIKRTINNEKKPTQKITFVGTKFSGKYVLYDTDNKAAENGNFIISQYKSITFTSTKGNQYWGEFTGENTASGSLLIPFSNTGNPVNYTGTWNMEKK